MAMLIYAFVAFGLLVNGYRRDAVGGAVVVLLFTMYPDLDSRFAFIPHRQITHTVWFAMLVGLGCAALIATGVLYRQTSRRRAIRAVSWSFSLGTLAVLIHLFADALNPWGIMPFYPVSTMFVSFDLVKASNPMANYGLLLGGATLLTTSWYAGTAVAEEDIEPYTASVTTVKRWYSLVTSGRPRQ